MSNSNSAATQSLELQLQEVMHFWFDGDLHLNYKTKWFPSGNESIQRDADVKVNSLFKPYLDSAMSGEFDSVLDEETEAPFFKHLSVIVILDQFSRHIFRYQNLPGEASVRKEADVKALAISEKLLSKEGWDFEFSVSQHVFALMPYRHSATPKRLYDVLKSIDSRESKEMEMMELIGRFRKQTVRRLQHLEDREKASAGGDILERHPFVADESDILTQGVLISTRNFLQRCIGGKNKYNATNKSKSTEAGNQIVTSSSSSSEKSNERVKGKIVNHHSKISNSIAAATDSNNAPKPFPVAISLSGGVDSMVIAKILVVLRNHKIIPISEIIAIHIDYANRPESEEEADFVEKWCMELGIRFYKRVINEVTRGITDRNEYEKVTRDIRYSTYQQVLEESNCDAVIFGHHLGDVQENVISNVMRGSNPLQLSGMSETGITNGVCVWRPLLSHLKDDIYEFSHKYGVPYFKDTTPSWSTRGKLRNKLVPLLIDMYGEGCLRNLTSLANESDSFRDMVDKSIFLPFVQSIRRSKCGIIVNINAYKNQPLCFWKEALKEIMHSMSMSMIREKSVQVFIERIARRPAEMVGWLELRKGFHTYLYENGDFCVIADGIFGDIAKTGRILNPNRGSNSLKCQKIDANVEVVDVVGARRGEEEVTAASSSGGGLHKDLFEDKGAKNCWEDISLLSGCNWQSGLVVQVPNQSTRTVDLKMGLWEVKLAWISESTESQPNPLNSLFKRHLESDATPSVLKESSALTSVSDLLEESFIYYTAVPKHCTVLAVWSDFIVKLNSLHASIANHSVVPVHSLSKSDPRIRLGIPLLVPIVDKSTETNKSLSFGYSLVKFEYHLAK